MKIIKKNEYTGYYSKINEILYMGASEKLEELKEDLKAMITLTHSDFNEIEDNEFVRLISRFYYVFFSRQDLLNTLSKVSKTKYNKIEFLKTKIIYEDYVVEGRGKDFDCNANCYQINLVVATQDNFTVDYDYNYSINEINALAKDKNIILLDQISKINNSISFEPEDYKNLDIPRIEFEKNPILGWPYLYFNLEKGDTEYSNSVYNIYISLLRKKLSQKKVLNDLNKIFLAIKENFSLIENEAKQYYNDNNEIIKLYRILEK